MGLRLYDTLSREVREVAASDGKQLRLYVCGPTVYGPAHIGNFRTFCLFDVLVRTAQVAGLNPYYVRNITDVDDKTIRESQAQGQKLKDFTTAWTETFRADAHALNLLRPNEEPAATDHIPEMVAMIDTLLAKDHAYVGGDGSIYFRVSSFPEYGKLSHFDPSQLQTQEVQSGGQANLADEYERDSVSDFALWKAAKPEDGDNFWDGPQGIQGRPGWHIECSAMAGKHLVERFGTELPIDLHGGGEDLCFPHHENEIAQSESATGRLFVRHWFHTTHLLVDGAKMSKSLGNLYTLEDLRAKGVDPMVLRYVLISAHYRQQLNFTLNSLNAAKSALDRIGKVVTQLLQEAALEKSSWPGFLKRPFAHDFGIFSSTWEVLLNDLNTPAALGQLFGALKEVEKAEHSAPDAAILLKQLASVLYALGLDPLALPEAPAIDAPPEIEALARERWEAKQAKEWSKADELRAKLQEQGWVVKDRKDGYDLLPA